MPKTKKIAATIAAIFIAGSLAACSGSDASLSPQQKMQLVQDSCLVLSEAELEDEEGLWNSSGNWSEDGQTLRYQTYSLGNGGKHYKTDSFMTCVMGITSMPEDILFKMQNATASSGNQTATWPGFKVEYSNTGNFEEEHNFKMVLSTDTE